VAGAVVALVLAADGPDCRAAAAKLFPGLTPEILTPDRLRPSAPFDGPLFELLAARPSGSAAGLVVPVRAPGRGEGAAGSAGAGRRPAAGDLVPVADHVNLTGAGPLTGRWPAGVPRDFPGMTGIYQPALVRPVEGARVYSSGVVAAGVADARRLTRFEARAVREGGWPIVSDSLVPVAIVAAYYGVRLAACGLVQAPSTTESEARVG
jgi:hypothetical protein